MTVSSSKDIKDLCLEIMNGNASAWTEAEKTRPEKRRKAGPRKKRLKRDSKE